jgi:hypothetical protein
MNQNPHDPNRENDVSVPAQPSTGRRVNDTVDDMATSIRDFMTKVPETINKAVERALNVREATVLLKLNENVAEALDTLVTSGVFKSRADAAAFLVEEGIRAQTPLFVRIQAKLNEIERLREELRHSIAAESE